jgi:leucyl aminopeptidase
MTHPLTISFIKKPAVKMTVDTVVVTILKDNKLSASAKTVDDQSGGIMTAFLKRQKTFHGKSGQTASLAALPKQGFARIILLGIDDPKSLTHRDGEVIGSKLHATLQAAGAENVLVYADGIGADALATGLKLKTYAFTQYRSKKKDDKSPKLSKITLISVDADKAEKSFKALNAAVTGVFLARDLANLPPNDLYPETYAAQIKKELIPLGVTVEILDEKKLKTLGFGAHLAVGQGSIRPPRVVIMRWNGLGKGKKAKDGPLALVGKGITFDTGGISIKPAGGMDEMKMDMGGSAAVVGTFKALALRKAKTDVVGIVALAENMPGHNAYRPGDIIRSLSGKTIEVLNTDAEGRLVLCDSLTYVQHKYKPSAIIDLATLTGAIIVALGHEYCGSFVNDDGLWSKIEKSGKEVGEKYWRMPLDEHFRKDVESKVADLRNIGSAGKAGSCTAAAFLEWFIEGKTPWAHLDIAGTGMSSAQGGTGFAVRTLDRLISEYYEK